MKNKTLAKLLIAVFFFHLLTVFVEVFGDINLNGIDALLPLAYFIVGVMAVARLFTLPD